MDSQDSNIQKKKKQIIFHAVLLILSLILLISLALFFMAERSGAWLVSKGKWSDTVYNVGRIDYTYEINNHNVNTTIQDFTATVPIIGGVKINDSASGSGLNFQPYAEENFNEGVTLAHILITNKSDFQISITASFEFENLFDSPVNSQNIFYLILPQGAVVNTQNHTVTLSGGGTYTFKNYIKSCMSDYSTYEAMKASLQTYYQNNSDLKSHGFTLAAPRNITGTQLNFDILFWSEYNETLPYVTGSGSSESLDFPDELVNSLEGQFKFYMDIHQRSKTP